MIVQSNEKKMEPPSLRQKKWIRRNETLFWNECLAERPKCAIFVVGVTSKEEHRRAMDADRGACTP